MNDPMIIAWAEQNDISYLQAKHQLALVGSSECDWCQSADPGPSDLTPLVSKLATPAAPGDTK